MSARISALLCGAASFLLIAPEPAAIAQQSAQASASAGLEEIVVTARRREEKLQNVPVAITAFTPKAIEENHIESASDLQHFVPSLLSSQETRDEQVFYLRGQGPNGGQGGAPGVVTYFSEVPFYASGPGIYYDLDNLQVLRGPQGTLFGRNTTGGAVLFEPKHPTNAFEGYAEVAFGDYGLHEEQGAINVPIIDDVLLVRGAFDIDQRDGFTHDFSTGKDLDNRDYWSFRLGVTWRPTDDFENYIVYDSLYSHTNGTGIILQAINTFRDPHGIASNETSWVQTFCPAAPAPCLLPQQLLAQQAAVGPRGTFTDGGLNGLDGLDKTYSYGITDIAKYDLSDDVSIKNIFGYRVLKNLLRYDLDGMPLTVINFQTPNNWNLSNVQYTDEMQFQGKSLGGNLTWIAGGFYEFLHPGGQTVAEIDTTSVIAPHLFQIPLGVQVLSNAQGQNSLGPEGITERTEAVFAQGTYNLGGISEALEDFKFTAGARYTWDYTSNSNFETVNVFLPAAFGGAQVAHIPCDPCTYESHTFQAPTWTVDLDYQINPNMMAYVTARRGFKSGGFNGAGTPPFAIKYESEYVTDVEIGFKGDFDLYGVKLRTNIDGFHDDYRNAQRAVGVLVQTVPAPAPKTSTTLIANGDVTIEGMEFEGTVVPVSGLELTADWTYIHARYDQFFIPTVGDERDLPYPFTPKNKFSFAATYHLPFIPEEMGDIALQASYVHTSRVQYATSDIEPFGNEPGYGLTDLNVEWTNVFQQPIDATFFMTNVTDNVVKLGNVGIYNSSGYVSGIFNEPRMWGFRLRYRFGGGEEHEAAPAEPAAAAPPPPPPAAPKSYLVFFDFDKSTLTSEGRNIVDQAAANAGPAKVTRIVVTGHTDTVGSDAYNMRLSKRRAESVAAELEAKGIASDEISLVAKGKHDLLVPTADGVREPQNRRVEIVYGGGPNS
ncbi:MAG TPA: TonB-dependent receptor [Alphaproteobacteria bacterium]|nr:TonB-dependent receptor [Alphaproteobacteria bacterium]